MGPAILNGGITTFLALFFLAFSQSYAFIVFFKVFFLTVIFGLFHGLVFLPVVLIVLGSNNEAPSRSNSVSSGFSDSSSVDAQHAKGIKPTIAVGNKGFVPDELQPRPSTNNLYKSGWSLVPEARRLSQLVVDSFRKSSKDGVQVTGVYQPMDDPAGSSASTPAGDEAAAGSRRQSAAAEQRQRRVGSVAAP